MNKTAITHIIFKVADDTKSRIFSDTVKAVALAVGVVTTREYEIGADAVTHLGLTSALQTLIVPRGAIDLNFTIGSETIEMLDVSTPVVLPCAIVQVVITRPTGVTDTRSVSIIQCA